LTEAVRGVVAPIAGLRLDVVSTPDEARRRIGEAAVRVVLVHQTDGDAGPLRLLGEIRARGQDVAALVVGEAGHAAEELAALRAGAICYLKASPLDRNRLAYLLDLLTIRSRRATPPL
jgi:DNA-binding NtrC family response regulator